MVEGSLCHVVGHCGSIPDQRKPLHASASLERHPKLLKDRRSHVHVVVNGQVGEGGVLFEQLLRFLHVKVLEMGQRQGLHCVIDQQTANDVRGAAPEAQAPQVQRGY
eukprot:CAMPEP_0174305170 /NCGR_PEP_ID=MMETSP0809-20121228/61247_1 /TAXON_ID=73025 ORGANISM="Eutreptiella gymnastica-like, Strain CCMP1594" /NCGR_SAMPLE_ID=MMETSP0809 /ASSEMBLY_ACC=CAM_ASM_000658 /LENGTH=106 /DNA_ID=CAMNT_0015411587 /DNA_START=1825 /DNA_END=2142 /DNA_ORIENTATION=+